MMLRQCLAIAAATPNLIPIPAAHAPSTDQPVKLQCFRSSYLSKTDARTPQIPIDCSGETEPLPARDFVPWRFSDACRRARGWLCRRPRNLRICGLPKSKVSPLIISQNTEFTECYFQHERH